MLCASLRTTVGLTVAGHAPWFVSHLCDPLPAICTWGYYRSGILRAFGKRLGKAYMARLCEGARLVDSAGTCQVVRARTDFKLHTAAGWEAFCSCFRMQLSGPHKSLGVHVICMVLGAGMGLTNVVFWGSAFFAVAWPTLHSGAATSVGARLWNTSQRILTRAASHNRAHATNSVPPRG